LEVITATSTPKTLQKRPNRRNNTCYKILRQKKEIWKVLKTAPNRASSVPVLARETFSREIHGAIFDATPRLEAGSTLKCDDRKRRLFVSQTIQEGRENPRRIFYHHQ